MWRETPEGGDICIIMANLHCCMAGTRASQVAAGVKNLPANAGDVRNGDLIPGLGRPPGEGHGNPLQYSCLENPMDSEAWQATVHGVAKSWTELSEFHFHTRCRSQR